MSRPPWPLLAVLLACSACVYNPGPDPEPVPVRTKYDRSFDAALGAATDIGVQVTAADRTVGRIVGIRAGVEVIVEVQRQPDGSLNVEFNAPGSTETNPNLSDRWLKAYQRRMGR